MSRRLSAVRACAAFASVWLAAPLAAQTGMPFDIESKLAELRALVNLSEPGKIFAPLQDRLYARLQEKEPYKGIKVTRDVKYGPDERNALDVFAAEQPASGPRPVLMFVHGGGFVGGSRRIPGSPFYDNVMLFAARNGMVGINVSYRLAPQHPWPAAAQDLGSAVRWVNESVAAHGGDPARVYLMGHSAGAVHVATYVADSRLHGPKGIGLAGAILLSGLYDLTTMALRPSEMDYFGEDASKYAERSPLAGLVKTTIPLMAVHASLDTARFRQQAQQLNQELCKAGRCPRFVALAKHSHASEIYAFNTRDKALSDQVLAFVNNGK